MYTQLGSLTLDISDVMDTCPNWKHFKAGLEQFAFGLGADEDVLVLHPSVCPFDEGQLRGKLGIAARADKAAAPGSGAAHPPGNNTKARRRRR